MKYIRIGISRKQYTDLYLKVPDDFNNSSAFSKLTSEDLEPAVDETLDEMEWECNSWGYVYEVEEIKDVLEEIATQYSVYNTEDW